MRTCPSCGYVNELGDAADVSYCLSPGCGALLPAPEREPARPQAELKPSVEPRIPARALTPILGVGVVALAAVTILVAANNSPRPPAQTLPSLFEPMVPALVTPSPVDTGSASAAPGQRPTPSPSATKSPRPRISPVPPPAGQPNSGMWQSSDDVMIPDGAGEANSMITVFGKPGNAPTNLLVSVHIKHKARGDLAIDLIGPTGAKFSLPVGEPGTDLNKTYTVDASSQPCNGTWRLRVRDVNAEGSVGYVDKWTIEFS
ncbi:proprotein convertase P-domain-containing protein [Allorhizocola rhizosphaerae]|uniref:proprotein convertase P-domain-containing protein n=1 Tax=Allorhizocola rhizosphaerae TaxID=1872709 RepID=UPI001FEABC0C|nr:proprotein convertase P-domain-containing protein [Allorhizocola rhizosphaerae]